MCVFSLEEFLLSFSSQRPHPCLQPLFLATSLAHTFLLNTHPPTDTRHLSGSNVLSSAEGLIEFFCNVTKWHQKILRLKNEVTEL